MPLKHVSFVFDSSYLAQLCFSSSVKIFILITKQFGKCQDYKFVQSKGHFSRLTDGHPIAVSEKAQSQHPEFSIFNMDPDNKRLQNSISEIKGEVLDTMSIHYTENNFEITTNQNSPNSWPTIVVSFRSRQDSACCNVFSHPVSMSAVTSFSPYITKLCLIIVLCCTYFENQKPRELPFLKHQHSHLHRLLCETVLQHIEYMRNMLQL